MSETAAPPPVQRYEAAQILLPDDRVLTGGALEVSQGRIVRLLDAEERAERAHDGTPTRDLGQVALVPGLVNAHSHAFQRDLRGQTEWLHRDRPQEDFWSWREAMYQLALGYSVEAFEAAATRAFWEMALTGITCVGEFHYVHHAPDGSRYEDPDALAHAVVRAARKVGLRLSLLRVSYHRAGHGKPATPSQRRFIDASVAQSLERLDALQTHYAHAPDVRIGVAPHSIRAVPESWLTALSAWAAEHEAPLHLHACEQRAEISQSLEEYGLPPIALFERAGVFQARPTLVHATHLSQSELDVLARHASSSFVCACPSTERNLGDGFLPARELLERGVRLCLGSDSHANIDLWDELRLVEYHERLRYERRNVLADAAIWSRWFPERASQERHEVAPLLFPMATRHGAQALGWQEAGRLEAGALADFVAVDLTHFSMRGTRPERLLTDLSFSLKPGAIKEVIIDGVSRVRDGRHLTLDEAALEG